MRGRRSRGSAARRRRDDRPGRGRHGAGLRAAACRVSGVVLTKIEGDARGGAALSLRAVTGKPIVFAGTGEKLDALEAFHPDRIASRILGMGDVLSLIERAEKAYDRSQAEALQKKLKQERVRPRGLPRAAPRREEDGLRRPSCSA